MKIDVRIISSDFVEVTCSPSWLWWLLGRPFERGAAVRVGGDWLWLHEPSAGPNRAAVDAVSRAFADLDARRAAETARNYQAAAQRGEYPIR